MYSEIHTTAIPIGSTGNSTYLPATATRLVIDDVHFREGTVWRLNVGLLVGLLVMFAVLIGGAVYWYLRRKRKAAENAELAELREKMALNGLGYSAIGDSSVTSPSTASQASGAAVMRKRGKPK